MKETPTDNLNTELMSPSPLDAYLKEHSDEFLSADIVELLERFYEGKQISKAELARRAGISEVYLHQVFSGRRTPSRDRLLCLCVGMGVKLEEAQTLLKRAGYAQMYAKFKRDTIIMYGIAHKLDLSEINDKLFTENERTLL